MTTGTVVITGAAGGMGRPAAQRFAAQGRPLLLCDLDPVRLEALAEELRPAAGKVDILAADIAAEDFPARIVATLGGAPISALVHTAGLSPTMSDGSRIFSVNYDATERLVAGLLPHFAEGGCAVLISSVSAYMLGDPALLAAIREFVTTGKRDGIAGYMDHPGMAYAISKRAVIGIVERDAPAFGARGLRIASIAPGFIATPMGNAEAEANEQLRKMIDIVPQGRMGQGDEIASVAEFLCSPAASYVSGVDIRVDGGIIGLLNTKGSGQ
ncbi:SDR family oxidoreductase [Novosphingobium sp. fls2-241-R2A-195]|jgi:NAD(P)-dependent dehydrogenase (short-subunit alcohol dehydrogenase family)|uniref:SDR family NAD(P)-dependent oxidoreductase n=1 Tax=Novosphingobium sp. fls2-241-R2A-195 TaxID=3040296 RepID=UPI00254DFADF|nr:SDR family oxidoreductase [Novosphingobium sp. fls2-241-R2A-195]